MCGLVGMMGALEQRHRNAMKDLLYFDTLRGQDSTGVASVSRNRAVSLRKMTVPGYDFVNMNFIDNLLGVNDQLWLGHNRFKTRGAVSRLNAHPFEVINGEGTIDMIGAHNGTLENQWEIEKALGDQRFGTDSEGLINLINEVGAKDAIAEAKGAWSLVWWKAAENKLCFLRNDKRPMFFAYSKDRKVLVWASEVWMILAACNRHGVDLEQTEGGLSVYSTTVDTLYSFDIPQTKSEIGSPKKEGGLLGKPEKPAFSPSSNYYGGGSVWDKLDAESEAAEAAAKAGGSTTPSSSNNVTPINRGAIRGFNGRSISAQERDQIAAKGCGWCGDKITPNTSSAFLNVDTMSCYKCNLGKHELVLDPPKPVLTVQKKKA